MITRPDAVRLAPPVTDRRATRRQQTEDEIVAAAWALAREQGLAGLAMRDLGAGVGMKAQSIYSHFGSKHEIYDAMFHKAYLAFAAAMYGQDGLSVDTADPSESPRIAARPTAHRFFKFCTSDPVRYQLRFQRTIPEFTPSAESYAVAVEAMQARLAAFGITDPDAVDLWTGLMTGLTDQQISNDPGGDRWVRLIDRAVDMVRREVAPQTFDPTT